MVSWLGSSVAFTLVMLYPFLSHYWAKWDVGNYERISGKKFSERRRERLFSQFRFHSSLELGLFTLGVAVGVLLCSI